MVSKNILQVVLLLGFLNVNVWGIYMTKTTDGGANMNYAAKCHIPLLKFPEVDLTGDGAAYFECSPKNTTFNMILASVGILCQVGSRIL